MDEGNDYRKEREARARQEHRRRIATLIFRDLCAEDNHCHPNRDEPQDFAAMACCAVEAADALLTALEIDPEEKIIPDYEA